MKPKCEICRKANLFFAINESEGLCFRPSCIETLQRRQALALYYMFTALDVSFDEPERFAGAVKMVSFLTLMDLETARRHLVDAVQHYHHERNETEQPL